MVGGVVVDIATVSPKRVWVGTKEPRAYRDETVGVYCDPQGESIQVGDALWWQGGWCMYTPRVHPDGRSDVKLPKLSGSGVAKPEVVN